MKIFSLVNWLAKIKTIAVMSVIALSFPAVAMAIPTSTRLAQASTTDQNFLKDLYSFLHSQDAIAYHLATEADVQENLIPNIAFAQAICFDIANGIEAEENYNLVMSDISTMASGMDQLAREEILYSASLYFGTVMNLGSAYYCPEYQAEIVQFLSTQ